MKRPDDLFKKMLSRDLLILEGRIIQGLKNICELCVTEAIENGNYKNVTGNLRRSVGYVIAKNGVILHMSDMNLQGKSLAMSLAVKSTGIKAYVLAGMEYAEVVEARGKNVIASSELLAESIVPKIMNQLGFILK